MQLRRVCRVERTRHCSESRKQFIGGQMFAGCAVECASYLQANSGSSNTARSSVLELRSRTSLTTMSFTSAWREVETGDRRAAEVARKEQEEGRAVDLAFCSPREMPFAISRLLCPRATSRIDPEHQSHDAAASSGHLQRHPLPAGVSDLTGLHAIACSSHATSSVRLATRVSR